ncbi:hypothetical protein TanjilG_13971 [Lupinus angustifolius]|uniref:Uncharacterized protein n=1 Tax=Lupinus angustifolius TaxID=3871 RepID=A0A1J7HQU9_LUPAN|nr:hypothetical protein TanjilG_13971 [Lupinus angustifolius]
MATVNSDDNTSSDPDPDPIEPSSEDDCNTSKRQKLGETEKSEKEENQGSDDEKVYSPIVGVPDDEEVYSPIVGVPDEETDVELDDEDESNTEELVFHLRGEEMFFIEERQKQLAEAAKQGQEDASSSSKPLPMLIIHHSEGEFFQKRAQEAKKALEDRIPGIYVHVNSRQRMEPPFTELVELDMENLAWEISVFIKH